MEHRLQTATLLVKIAIAVLIVLTGATVVRNVTVALSGHHTTSAQSVAPMR